MSHSIDMPNFFLTIRIFSGDTAVIPVKKEPSSRKKRHASQQNYIALWAYIDYGVYTRFDSFYIKKSYYHGYIIYIDYCLLL